MNPQDVDLKTQLLSWAVPTADLTGRITQEISSEQPAVSELIAVIASLQSELKALSSTTAELRTEVAQLRAELHRPIRLSPFIPSETLVSLQ